MSEFDLAIVLVECSFKDFLNPPERSEIHSSQAFGSALAWWAEYGVGFLFAGGRKLGQKSTSKLLEKYKKYFNHDQKLN